MPRNAAPRSAAPVRPQEPKWTPEQLKAVAHMGPGVIGHEMHEAAQRYLKETNGGVFGPALLGSKEHDQSGPVKLVDGKPIFARDLVEVGA